MLATSPANLGEALQSALRYAPLVVTAFQLRREDLGDEAYIVAEPSHSFSSVHDFFAETVMLAFTNITPLLTEPIVGASVCLRQASIGDPASSAPIWTYLPPSASICPWTSWMATSASGKTPRPPQPAASSPSTSYCVPGGLALGAERAQSAGHAGHWLVLRWVAPHGLQRRIAGVRAAPRTGTTQPQ